MHNHRFGGFGIALMFSLLMHNVAQALPTFQVNSTADLVDDDLSDGICHTSAGTCTLRAAVMQANTFALQGSTINLPPGTYTLTRPILGNDGDSEGNLNLTGGGGQNAVTAIRGAGAAATIIDANQIDNVLTVDAATAAYISGVTLRNGSSSFGGCIVNLGVLTLENSVVAHCLARSYGGGISNKAVLKLINTTVSDNQVTSVGAGGGIANDHDMTVTNSAIINNQAGDGGGLSTENGVAILVNTTIAGNTANYGGGAHQIMNSALQLFNVTVAFNQSPRDQTQEYGAAGLYNMGNGGTIDLYNSIVAANYDLLNRSDYDCDGALRVNTRNLLGVAPVCDQQGCSPSGIEGCALTVLGNLQSAQYIGLPRPTRGQWRPYTNHRAPSRQ